MTVPALAQVEILADREVVEQTLRAIAGDIGDRLLGGATTAGPEADMSAGLLETRYRADQFAPAGAFDSDDGKNFADAERDLDVEELPSCGASTR